MTFSVHCRSTGQPVQKLLQNGFLGGIGMQAPWENLSWKQRKSDYNHPTGTSWSPQNSWFREFHIITQQTRKKSCLGFKCCWLPFFQNLWAVQLANHSDFCHVCRFMSTPRGAMQSARRWVGSTPPGNSRSHQGTPEAKRWLYPGFLLWFLMASTILYPSPITSSEPSWALQWFEQTSHGNLKKRPPLEKETELYKPSIGLSPLPVIVEMKVYRDSLLKM